MAALAGYRLAWYLLLMAALREFTFLKPLATHGDGDGAGGGGGRTATVLRDGIGLAGLLDIDAF